MPLWMILAFAAFSIAMFYAHAQLKKKEKKQPAQAVLSAYIFYALLFFAVWVFAVSIPTYILALALLAVFINGFYGHHLDWFNRSIIFDRYLHAYGSFSFALLAFCAVRTLLHTGGSKAFLSLFVFAAGMALSTMFELLEALIDSKIDANNQRGLQDTNTDMACNLIGSILAASYAWLLLI